MFREELKMAESRKEIRNEKAGSSKSKLFKVIAVVLILAGVGVLGFAGFQKLYVGYQQAKLREAYQATAGFKRVELVPEMIAIEEWQPMRMVIPAIDVDLITVGGGNVFDRALLEKGPTHFNDLTSMGLNVPGDLPNTEKGNVGFAGHRAGRFNFFLNIDKLNEGDEIYLDVAGYRFIYLVEWVKVYSKYDWEPLETTDYPAITLQTCEPPHVINPNYRLMARGKLESVIPVPVELPDAD
jgi:LPXTG-site transpeptidase (sortase) family protein